MAQFVARYWFDKEHCIQEALEAHNLGEAEQAVVMKMGQVLMPGAVDTGVFNVVAKGRLYVVAKSMVRFCEVMPIEDASKSHLPIPR